MGKIENPMVSKKFETYPKSIQQKLLCLRQLIYEVAEETEDIGELEETLKWGEPSYLTDGGSTLRIDWKESEPDKYAMYFNCNTKLVDTFKEVYSDKFHFEDNRAIIFHKQDKLPTRELKHCIGLTLQYHKLKHLPMLGI